MTVSPGLHVEPGEGWPALVPSRKDPCSGIHFLPPWPMAKAHTAQMPPDHLCFLLTCPSPEVGWAWVKVAKGDYLCRVWTQVGHLECGGRYPQVMSTHDQRGWGQEGKHVADFVRKFHGG